MLATPPPSLKDKITGRYGQAAYLGPDIASGSHIAQFRLRDGSFKIARAARMVVPVTFELSCLRGLCHLLPGRSAEAARKFPEVEGGEVRDLLLPNVETRGPPREWIEEHGKTPRRRVCRARGIDVSKALHSPACRKRYAEFIQNAFDPAKFLLDEAQAELEGGEEDLGERGFSREAELELPDGPALNDELEDYVPDYEPEPVAQPGAGVGSDDDVERGELDVELELRDGVPRGLGSSPVELEEDEERMMDVDPEPLDRIPPAEADSMAMNVQYRESLVFAVGRDVGTEKLVELGGEKLFVEVPSQAKDDIPGSLLDLGMTYDGMLREQKALESLAVGDVIWEVKPGEKTISARWVSNAKKERVDGKEIPLVR